MEDTKYHVQERKESDPLNDTFVEIAIKSFESTANNFGIRFINDSNLRQEYARKVKVVSEELLNNYNRRFSSPQLVAEEAVALRNSIMEETRRLTSDVGKAVAQKLKSEGKSLAELCEHYSYKLYTKEFGKLSTIQKNKIYFTIVERSGFTNDSVTAQTKSLAKAGRGLLVITIAISVYNIFSAEDKVYAAKKEGVSLAGGFLGGAAGGAAFGLMCGPGAPVCVTVGAFVGGVLGVMGTEWAFNF